MASNFFGFLIGVLYEKRDRRLAPALSIVQHDKAIRDFWADFIDLLADTPLCGCLRSALDHYSWIGLPGSRKWCQKVRLSVWNLSHLFEFEGFLGFSELSI